MSNAKDIKDIDIFEDPKEGYSIFKVLDRHQKLAPYNASSRRRSMAYVKIDKSKRGYVKFVRGLRDKYKVDVREDIVKDALSSPI